MDNCANSTYSVKQEPTDSSYPNVSLPVVVPLFSPPGTSQFVEADALATEKSHSKNDNDRNDKKDIETKNDNSRSNNCVINPNKLFADRPPIIDFSGHRRNLSPSSATSSFCHFDNNNEIRDRMMTNKILNATPANNGAFISLNSGNNKLNNSALKLISSNLRSFDPPIQSSSHLSNLSLEQQQQKLSQQPYGSNNNYPNANICAACNIKIADRYLLKVAEKVFHESCLRCIACNCLLNEEHRSLFVKNDNIYCRNDYGRLFGVKGQCSVCQNVIHTTELIMRAANNVYHVECFACQECNHRFCVGDTFYFDFDNNKILCEYHYNEKIFFAQLSRGSLAQLKRKISQETDGSNLMAMNYHKQVTAMKR